MNIKITCSIIVVDYTFYINGAFKKHDASIDVICNG